MTGTDGYGVQGFGGQEAGECFQECVMAWVNRHMLGDKESGLLEVGEGHWYYTAGSLILYLILSAAGIYILKAVSDHT